MEFWVAVAHEKSVTVVIEQSYSLLIVRLSELLVGIISCSCALPQYLTSAMFIGDFSLTKYSSISKSCIIHVDS